MSADILTLPIATAQPEPVAPATPWGRVVEAAAHGRVHPQEIYRACRRGQLEHVKVGGRRTILLRRERVDTWLASQVVHVKPAA
jgi:excisionase family DNA binding protein